MSDKKYQITVRCYEDSVEATLKLASYLDNPTAKTTAKVCLFRYVVFTNPRWDSEAEAYMAAMRLVSAMWNSVYFTPKSEGTLRGYWAMEPIIEEVE